MLNSRRVRFCGLAILAFGLLTAAAHAQRGSAIAALRTDGYNAGYRDGVNDARVNQPYSFQNQPAYRNAARNWQPGGLDQPTYALVFRSGYENGYDDGYYGRPGDPNAQVERHYHNEAAFASTGASQASGFVPAGTVLHLSLNNSLSTRFSQPGDSFSATVNDPVLSQDGLQVLIPRGSEVEGVVAAVNQAGAVSGNSTLSLRFTQIHLLGGQVTKLDADVSGSGVGTTNNEGQITHQQGQDAVGHAAIGGILGTMFGAVVGGGKGAAIGAAGGAGLGLAVASQKSQLDLPAGTAVAITLDRRLHVHPPDAGVGM